MENVNNNNNEYKTNYREITMAAINNNRKSYLLGIRINVSYYYYNRKYRMSNWMNDCLT